MLTLLFLLGLFITLVVADDSCTSFVINGSLPSTFQYHRFYDFRNLENTTLLQNNFLPFNTAVRTQNVNNLAWTEDWKIKEQLKEPTDTDNDTITWNYTPNNVYIETNHDSKARDISTHLTLSASQLPAQTGAEIDFTNADILYASVRVMARVMGSPGAVAGIFTYHNDTNESDIEIITRDGTSNIHYANQPTTDDDANTIFGSTFNITIPNNAKWTDWHNYRLDWLPGQSVWYVDGVKTADTSVHVPEAPSAIILNMWSNGGRFSGSMSEGSQAVMQVGWIEIAFNTSNEYVANLKQKAKMCTVENKVGNPTSPAAREIGRSFAFLVLPALFAFWISL